MLEEHVKLFMPKGSNQQNPDLGKLYRTNDPVSSTNKWHEKQQESGTCYKRKDLKHTPKCNAWTCLDPNLNKLKIGISETMRENQTQTILY